MSPFGAARILVGVRVTDIELAGGSRGENQRAYISFSRRDGSGVSVRDTCQRGDGCHC